MSDLDTSYARLLGRQPSDAERQRLYRVREALGLRDNDALWQVLFALDHHQTLYNEVPEKIRRAAREVLAEFRTSADREAQASMAIAREDLTKAVSDTAREVAHDTAGRDRFRWLTYAVGVAAACVIILAISAYLALTHSRDQGYTDGYRAGYNAGIAEARVEEAAASWANTPEGRMAYGLSQGGSLRRLATCDAPGWTWELQGDRMICFPFRNPASGKVHGWALAPGVRVP